MIIKKIIRAFGYYHVFLFRYARKTSGERVYGYTGSVKPGFCVPLFDIDDVRVSSVEKVIMQAREKVCLPVWYVFKTTKGFHICSPYIVSVKEYQEMLLSLKGLIDPVFSRISYVKGFGVLRLTSKRGCEPRVFKVYLFGDGLAKGKNIKKLSFAHMKALHAWFGLPKMDGPGVEGRLKLASYRT